MHLSPNDSNQYRYITLSNALRVLLIHSDTAQQSAAALAVNVGHFDDPMDRQGLAHYLEHMLFGYEKYPKVGEFQSYISQHGGTNNAWTGTEHTVSSSMSHQLLLKLRLIASANSLPHHCLTKKR